VEFLVLSCPSGEENPSLPECDAMSVGEYFLAFWGTLLSPYLGYKQSKFLFVVIRNGNCLVPKIHVELHPSRAALPTFSRFLTKGSRPGCIKMSSGCPFKHQILSFFDVLHTPTVLPIKLPFHFPKLYLASNYF
jgi:hypothetical protein